MALIEYPGTTPPTVVHTEEFSSVAGTVYYFTPTLELRNGWQVGASLYLIINISSAVISVTSIGTAFGGGAWTLVSKVVRGSLTQEVWTNSTFPTASTPFDINLSASTVINVSALIFPNADKVAPGDISQSGLTASTAFDSGPISPTEDNAIVYMVTRIRAAAATTLNIARTVTPGGLIISTVGSGSVLQDYNIASPIPISGNNLGLFRAETSTAANGQRPEWRGTLSAAKDFITTRFTMRGQKSALDDYGYKYADTGIVLNNFVGTPIYDIEKITGLTDIKIDSASSDYDGSDGGYTFAKYLGQKTIVLEGTVYGSPFTEAIADDLRSNFFPSEANKGFHYAHPGVGCRTIYCKPIGFTADISRARARGVMPFQIQLQASDPRAYGESHETMLQPSSGTLALVTLVGNCSVLPVIWFHVEQIEISNATLYTFKNVRTGQIVSVSAGGQPVGMYKLDFAARKLYRYTLTNGVASLVDCSNKIIARDWWELSPKAENAITYFTAPVITTQYSSMYYTDAYI